MTSKKKIFLSNKYILDVFICPIDRALKSITTPGYSGAESASNDRVLLTPHISYCYIITGWFCYINHFSLIIFYHSVWLGFELFGF